MEKQAIIKKMQKDDFSFYTNDRDEFVEVLDAMAEETTIQTGIVTSAVTVTPCALPADLSFEVSEMHEDTLKFSKLNLNYGWESHYIRDCAVETIETVAARLSGSGLRTTRERNVDDYAEGINFFIKNAKTEGKSMLIHRAGKLTAMHGSNYAYIPQNEIFERIESRLNSDMYGGSEFVRGELDHRITKALWILENDKFVEAYHAIFEKVGSKYVDTNFVCGVQLTTSDVSCAAVEVRPVFIESRRSIPHFFSKGMKTVHEYRRGEKAPLDILDEELKDGALIKLFTESIAKMEELAAVIVNHPENCVVSLCNKFAIPRKWGEYARASVEMFDSLTAYDVYCCATCSATSLKR